jgi:PEP-utilising enzyme, PEP-binding domain
VLPVRIDYSFVKKIGRAEFSADEIHALRSLAIRDSHCDDILKEALLDGDYDLDCLGSQIAQLGDDFILNSFPCQLFTATNLLIRSEFLALWHVGGGQLTFSDIDTIVDQTRRRLSALKPRAVMYRLCDYNPTDFTFIEETTPSLRGAARLIAQDELLDFDLKTIQAILSEDIPLDVLIPYVRFPEELDILVNRLRAAFTSSKRPRRLGMMLELPANLFELQCYEGVDFFVFGPADLLRCFYGGLNRNDGSLEGTSENVLIEPVRYALSRIDRQGGKTVYLAKRLIELISEFALQSLERTKVQRVYLPYQLAGTTELPSGEGKTRRQFRKGAAGNRGAANARVIR